MFYRLTSTAVILIACLGCTRPPVDTRTPSELFNDATQAMKDDRPGEAIELFTRVIAAQPRNDSAYVNRAACHGALEEYELLFDDAGEAMEINEFNAKSHELIASYWLREGNTDMAHHFAKRLLRLDPSNEVAAEVLRVLRE